MIPKFYQNRIILVGSLSITLIEKHYLETGKVRTQAFISCLLAEMPFQQGSCGRRDDSGEAQQRAHRKKGLGQMWPVPHTLSLSFYRRNKNTKMLISGHTMRSN